MAAKAKPTKRNALAAYRKPEPTAVEVLGTLTGELGDFGERTACSCLDSLIVELARNPTFAMIKPDLIGIVFRRLAGERDPALYGKRAEDFLKQIKPRGSLRPFCEMYMVDYYAGTDPETARALIARLIANKNAAWYHVRLLERLKDIFSAAGGVPGKQEIALLNKVRARAMPGSSTWKSATAKEFSKHVAEISAVHSAEESKYNAFHQRLWNMARDNAGDAVEVAHIRKYIGANPIEPFRSYAAKLLERYPEGPDAAVD